VLEALRNLLREVGALIIMLRDRSPVPGAVAERAQEAAVTWVATVRPGLARLHIPSEVLDRADRTTIALARAASHGVGVDRAMLLARLSTVRRVLYEQVLLEVARVPPGLLLSVPPAAGPAALFPEITDLPNQLVPYALQGWSVQIKAFLNRMSFAKNVFIMVAYRSKLEPLISAIKQKVEDLNLNAVLARDHRLTNDLYNPIACLLCCSYGIAVFDRAEVMQMHNPNVVYELGMMQLLKRPCVVLKHRKLRRMPTDLLSMLYEDYSTTREAVSALGGWWEKNNQ
jgi:hypothetical protein